MRKQRRVIAVNVNTGERKDFHSTYEAATKLRTSTQNIVFTLDRNGTCKGWRLYDTPETIRTRIAELQEKLVEVENM